MLSWRAIIRSLKDILHSNFREVSKSTIKYSIHRTQRCPEEMFNNVVPDN